MAGQPQEVASEATDRISEVRESLLALIRLLAVGVAKRMKSSVKESTLCRKQLPSSRRTRRTAPAKNRRSYHHKE
jgi:hypothetical protein